MIKKTKATKINGADNEHEEMCEIECVKCKIIKENSALTEVLHEMLVSELKEDLIGLTIRSDDEDYERDEKAYEAIENNLKSMHERHNIEK